MERGKWDSGTHRLRRAREGSIGGGRAVSTGLNLEIWFPQQTEVTVFLESSITDPEQEQFAETCLFALYAARQIANLRRDGYSLAGVLAATDTANPRRQAEERLGDVRVTSPRSAGGRKGFTAEIRERGGAFKLKAHGFGMLGKGVGYYSPISTMALLYWLLDRRKDDPHYQRVLATTAKNVGIAGSRGRISAMSQGGEATHAAVMAWGEAFEAGDAAEIDVPEALDLGSLPFQLSALVSSVKADMDQLLLDVPAEEIPGYRALVLSMPVCGFHVLAAAGLGDDERLIRSLTAVESAVDDVTQEAAKDHLSSVIDEMLEENNLSRVANAVYLAIATEAAESFQHTQG